DELQRRLRGDHVDVVAGLLEQPQQRRDLVGGDAAADAKDDALLGRHGVLPLLGCFGRRGVDLQQALVDLAQGDGERLLVELGVDQRADVLEEALVQLRVVGVDLAGPLGGVDDQGVLRIRGGQQFVDRRVDDAFKVRGHEASKFCVVFVGAGGYRYRWCGVSPIWETSSSAARWMSSFTIVTSNSFSAASSSLAVSRRLCCSSAVSVPRPMSRRTSSSQLGGARNTNLACGMDCLTWRAPCRSISSRTLRPAATASSTLVRMVP